MTDDRWGRTLTPTGDAMSAALGLAKDCEHDDVLLRDLPDGAVEVVTLRRGTVKRYLVHMSRAVEVRETLLPRRRWRIGRALVKVGVACLPLIVVAGFVLRPENSNLWMGAPLAVGFLMIVAGAFLMTPTKGYDLERYVGSLEGWARLPYKLGGWEPRTAAQLSAVTKLSDDGEGHAHVRDLADGRVEVLTRRKRQRFRHLLDQTGVILEEDIDRIENRSYLGARLIPLGIGACVLLAFVMLGNDARLVALGIAGAVLLAIVGRRAERRLEQRAEKPDWFVVHTEVPSD
jgi:hypothetical protein